MRTRRGLGSNHFPKRGHIKCHHNWVRSFPWTRFFDGVYASKKRSVTVCALPQYRNSRVFLPTWGAVSGVGSFLGKPEVGP